MKVRSVLVCLATAAALMLSAVPAHAAARQAITACGQTILGDAYLTRDLTCAVGLPLITTARLRELTGDPTRQVNATLDLQGHRLTGSDQPTVAAFSIYDQNNNPRLTVVNGRVNHWAVGLTSDNCCGTYLIDHVQIDHNGIGVNCGEAQTCTVTNSRIEKNTTGTSSAGLLSLSNVVISDNQVGSTSRAFGSEIVTNSYYLNNAVGLHLPDDQSEGGSADVRKTVFRGNGIGVRAVADAGSSSAVYLTLVGNLFFANGDGVYAVPQADNGDEITLQDNLALKNTRYGFYAPGANDAGDNRARSNGKPCVGVVCKVRVHVI